MPNEEPLVRGIIALIEIFPVNKKMKAVIEQSINSEDSELIDWSKIFNWNTVGNSSESSGQSKPSPHTFLTLLILQDLIVYDLPTADVNGE
jgi:hypothetical protein